MGQARITVIPITRRMATAIMDLRHISPHTAPLLPHMGTRLMLSLIVPGASAPTTRRARPISRTVASEFPAHSGRGEDAVARRWSACCGVGHYAAPVARQR
jgi:hypothetical protein